MERSGGDPHIHSPTDQGDRFTQKSTEEAIAHAKRLLERQILEAQIKSERDHLLVALIVGGLYPRLFRSKEARERGLRPIELLLLLACEFTEDLTQQQLALMLEVNEGTISAAFKVLRERDLVEPVQRAEYTPKRNLPRRSNQKLKRHRLTDMGREEMEYVGRRVTLARNAFFSQMAGDEPY